MSREQELVDALIAHAIRDAQGETVYRDEVEAAGFELAGLPEAAAILRRQMGRLNDPGAARTLEDWFMRLASLQVQA